MENIRKLEKEDWLFRSLGFRSRRPSPPDRQVALTWLKAGRPISTIRSLASKVLAYVRQGNSLAIAEDMVLGDIAFMLKSSPKRADAAKSHFDSGIGIREGLENKTSHTESSRVPQGRQKAKM